MNLQRLFLAATLFCTSNAVIAETVSSFFVDLGADVTVRSVTRLSDGTAVLVGESGSISEGTRQAKLFEVAADGSSFTSIDLVGLGGQSGARDISPNGQYVVGYSQSPGSVDVGEGTVWTRSSNWSAVGVGIESLSFKTSILSDVNSAGIAVGHQEGVRQPITWNPINGRSVLPHNFGIGGAFAITEDGRLSAGSGDVEGAINPILWSENGMEVIAAPDGNGAVRDMSENGAFLSGFSNSFDPVTFQTRTNATIWFDSDGLVSENQSASDYEFMHLPDGNGDPFQGEVMSISDNGFAVGGSVDGAFIWHESFDGVRLFDEWLLSEHGIDLPTNPTSINDVFFDGQNLNFAVQGSAYFVSANITAVPEPSAAALLILSTMAVCCRRRRKRA